MIEKKGKKRVKHLNQPRTLIEYFCTPYPKVTSQQIYCNRKNSFGPGLDNTAECMQ
jgi:hypothetical protein